MSDQNHLDERRTDLPADQMAEEHARDRVADDPISPINPESEGDLQGLDHQDTETEGQGDFQNEMAQYGAAYDDEFGIDEGVSYREETAAEVAPRLPSDRVDEDAEPLTGEEEGYREQLDSIDTRKEAEEGSTTLGWIALVLSLVSLFFLPVLMSTAGIVTGFFAYRGGRRTLGMWAIGVGLFSLIVALFISPYLTLAPRL